MWLAFLAAGFTQRVGGAVDAVFVRFAQKDCHGGKRGLHKGEGVERQATALLSFCNLCIPL